MKGRDITIQSGWFNAEYCCEHVQGGSKTCDKLCYVLEEGEDPEQLTVSRYCKRQANNGCEGCQGHAYCGPVIDVEGVQCFGKPGKRLVAIERYCSWQG